ncbi:MAG: prepilin peptidase [Gammaproteobacteria bacterium]
MELPSLFLLVLSLLLLIAVIEDVRNHRISNNLVICTFLSGILINLLVSESMGALLSVIGFVITGSLTGFFSLLPFYILGGMGAGDVKFFAALGTFLGPIATVYAVAMTLIFGAIIAIGIIIYQKYKDDYLVRSNPIHSKKRIISFPYAPAIALGTLGTVFII